MIKGLGLRKMLLVVVLALVFGTVAIFFWPWATKLAIISNTGRHYFTVEVADNDVERAKGLMARKILSPDAGMLFVFSEPVQVSFWMKNTVISLDMIFISENGEIVGITKDVPPLSLDHRPAPSPVLAVLEIAGGRADDLGIAVGDRVSHAAFR